MFLTPENLEKLRPQAQGLHISLTHFLEPSDEALLQAASGKAPSRSTLGHPLAGLPMWPVVATNRDPLLQEYSPPVGGRASNSTACYMATHSGGQLVTPARYMEAVRALRPDVFVTMADEVPASASRRRAAASVDRTARWLQECLALLPGAGWGHHQKQPTTDDHQQQPSGAGAQHRDAQQPAKRQRHHSAADGSSNEGDADAAPLVLAPVMGGSHPIERARAAQAVASAPVAGFALCGFGMGEDPALYLQLLAAALEHLPVDKPRLLQGMASPSEVLQGVLQGVDLFDCGYPMRATLDGVALCFPWAGPSGNGSGEGAGAEGTSLEDGEDGVMNLRLLKYRADARPIAQGCGCFTCRTHSRAYLHHLLDVNELLASVLLETHNTHWWLGFFSAIRAAIEGRRLEEYAAWWQSQGQRSVVGGAAAAL